MKGHNAYLGRLSAIDAQMDDPAEPLVTWGYHKIWHGAVDRRALNGISQTRPIFVWQRSFHEIVANDAAIDWMGLNRDDLARHEQIDPETGRFYETGLAVALNGMKDLLYAPERFLEGLEQVARAVHAGGHTTIGDMAVPLADLEMEWPALTQGAGPAGDPLPLPDDPPGHRARRRARRRTGRGRAGPGDGGARHPPNCNSATASSCSPTAASTPS